MEEDKKCKRCVNRVLADETFKMECKYKMPQYPVEGGSECKHFESKFIEYPITVTNVENYFNNELADLYGHKCGVLVRIRPCGEEYKDKTYLGILLGEFPIGAYTLFYKNTGVLEIWPRRNPAIFVPGLRKIIYGNESWWQEIEKPEVLTDITSEEISNLWYVKLLREMAEQ